MDEGPESAPSALRLRPALLVAMVLMVLWLAAYWRLADLDWPLFQLSWSGPRALALYVTGHYREAARAYRRGQHGSLRVPYENDPSGYRAFRAGRLDEAERRARTTLALVPTAIEPLVTLGEIALENGRTKEAARSFAAALERRHDHFDAMLLHAVAAARMDDRGRAIELINRALRWNAAGERDTVLYRVMELTGELRVRAPAEQPLCLLAHLHRYLRIFDDAHGPIAMEYARRAIRAGDRPAEAYLTLGIVHEKRGERADATLAMRRALEADPRQADALRWLAIQAHGIGDILHEYRFTKAAYEAAPKDPFYLRDLEYVMLVRLDDPQGMAATMEAALARDAKNAEAHERLGRAAKRLGDQTRARRHFQRAAELRTVARDGVAP